MSNLKQTITEMIKHILSEATEGEMQFAPLEAARKAYMEDKNDDTLDALGLMINKLVEPILAKMGFFWQAESYYAGGQIVFEAFNPRVDVTIDPFGSMGRYDVVITPMDESLTFDPVQMSVDTMKGAVQFISDTLGVRAGAELGRVGEPEGQGELPFKESLNRDSLRKMVSQAVIQELTFREQGRVKKGSPVIYRRVEAPDYKERREYRGRWMGFTDKTKLDSMVEFDAGKGPDGSDFLRIETAELMLDN
jgi:hypothetical protein|tara:strand:+ start:584 stop:1333 length:750 start_codon:yes stop_codon:yes gene_type:complete